MDDMKLEVEQFTVNRMLRGRVEVRLHAVELDVAVLQVLVEEASGARQHEVGSRVQLVAKLGAFLVELLAGELVNISIIEGEILLEVLQDGDVGLKIDRRLLGAHLAGIPGRHQTSAKVQMLLTGPLFHRGPGVLRVVELEVVHVSLLAVRRARYDRNDSDGLVDGLQEGEWQVTLELHVGSFSHGLG